MSFALNPFISFGSSGGGGNGSTGTGRITVGASGALYSTINDALNAGHHNMAVICDAYEIQDVTVPLLGMTVTIDPGAHLLMSSGSFLMNESAALEINGPGRLSYSYTSAADILFDTNGGGRLLVDGITLDNNSSVTHPLTDSNFARFSNIIFEGNINVTANDNVFNSCLYRNLSLFINNTANNTLFNGCNFEGISVADSGVNTVISNCVVH